MKNEVMGMKEVDINELDVVSGGVLTEEEKEDIRFTIRECKKNHVDPVELIKTLSDVLAQYGDNEFWNQDKLCFLITEWNFVKA
ncbi:MAG: hypothetical protein E7386_03020 [Ruminococcaceae bacterium]|nr:hypothetical protein [Oscillospiraceae bacterium]